MDFLSNLSARAELPWTPKYSQSGVDAADKDASGSVPPLEYWALALTITFTVLVYSFEGYLDGRQKKAYEKTTFPPELKTTVSSIDDEHEQTPLLPQMQEKFASSQSYGRDKISFAMISSAYDTCETVAFLLIGFLPYMWDKACAMGNAYFGWTEVDDEIKVSLVFLALITLVGMVTSLPFELVRNRRRRRFTLHIRSVLYVVNVHVVTSMIQFMLETRKGSSLMLLTCLLHCLPSFLLPYNHAVFYF